MPTLQAALLPSELQFAPAAAPPTRLPVIFEDNRSCDHRFIAKRAFSGPRLIWTAGMEHTGHHLWDKARQLLGVLTMNASLRQIYFSDISHRNGCAPASLNLRNAMAADVRLLEQEVETAGNIPRSGWLTCGSYPTGWHDATSRYGNPDLTAYVRSAENAGIDLRVVLMLRKTSEIVHDFTDSRLDTLLQSCQLLYEQMNALDPAFYRCIDYQNRRQPAALARMSAFTGMALSTDVVARAEASKRPPGFNQYNHSKDVAAIAALSPSAERRWRLLSRCHQNVADLCGQDAPELLDVQMMKEHLAPRASRQVLRR